MAEHELFVVLGVIWIVFAAIVFLVIRFLRFWHDLIDYFER